MLVFHLGHFTTNHILQPCCCVLTLFWSLPDALKVHSQTKFFSQLLFSSLRPKSKAAVFRKWNAAISNLSENWAWGWQVFQCLTVKKASGGSLICFFPLVICFFCCCFNQKLPHNKHSLLHNSLKWYVMILYLPCMQHLLIFSMFYSLLHSTLNIWCK